MKAIAIKPETYLGCGEYSPACFEVVEADTEQGLIERAAAAVMPSLDKYQRHGDGGDSELLVIERDLSVDLRVALATHIGRMIEERQAEAERTRQAEDAKNREYKRRKIEREIEAIENGELLRRRRDELASFDADTAPAAPPVEAAAEKATEKAKY